MSVRDWILFGLAVGVVAWLLMAREDPGGMIVTLLATILLGIGGALVGGFLGRMLEWYGEGNPVDFGLPVLGAILVVFLYRTLSGRQKSQWKEASPEPTEVGAILDAIGVSQTERRLGSKRKKVPGLCFDAMRVSLDQRGMFPG
ncbi:MAG: GlsB/YeaQ/YmgE family stress response membrane protein [Nitrospirales bacterium]